MRTNTNKIVVQKEFFFNADSFLHLHETNDANKQPSTSTERGHYDSASTGSPIVLE